MVDKVELVGMEFFGLALRIVTAASANLPGIGA